MCFLPRGELRCIGATTLDEYRKHVEKDAAFERRFQQVHVHEPSVSATISILRGLKDRYAAHHGVRILDSALVEAAQLAVSRHGKIPVNVGSQAVFRIFCLTNSTACKTWKYCVKTWDLIYFVGAPYLENSGL